LEVAGYRRAVLVGPTLRAVSAYGFVRRARLRGFPTLVLNAVLQATTRSTSRSSTPLQSITAATSHRVPVLDLRRFGVCAGQNTESEQGSGYASGYRGGTRGWDSIIRATRLQASLQGRGPRNRIVQRLLLAGRLRPRPGAVCLPRLTAIGRSSGQRRTSSLGWQASWVTRAPEASRRLHGGAGPEPSEAFCEYGYLTGCLPQAAGNGKGDRSQR
jgi:hypothetical protein